MTKLKHITVNQEVYQKLKSLGSAGDSFNDVLVRILATAGKQTERGEQKSVRV
jgi:predicted CopG family antitoxin